MVWGSGEYVRKPYKLRSIDATDTSQDTTGPPCRDRMKGDLTIKGLQDMFAAFALDNALKNSISKPCNALSFPPNLNVVNRINSPFHSSIGFDQ